MSLFCYWNEVRWLTRVCLHGLSYSILFSMKQKLHEDFWLIFSGCPHVYTRNEDPKTSPKPITVKNSSVVNKGCRLQIEQHYLVLKSCVHLSLFLAQFLVVKCGAWSPWPNPWNHRSFQAWHKSKQDQSGSGSIPGWWRQTLCPALHQEGALFLCSLHHLAKLCNKWKINLRVTIWKCVSKKKSTERNICALQKYLYHWVHKTIQCTCTLSFHETQSIPCFSKCVETHCCFFFHTGTNINQK